MRGQILSVEYMLFFAVGVIIIIITYTSLSGIIDTLRASSAETQLEKLGESVRLAALQIYETANSTGSNITFKMSMPTSLSGYQYVIEFKEGKIILSTLDKKIAKNISLYNIPASGFVYSTKGEIHIKSDGQNIVVL